MGIDPTLDPYVLLGRVVTMDRTQGQSCVLDDAAIYVLEGRIADIAKATQPPPQGFEGAAKVRTGGTIYPGLIELHNHLSYNAIPLWQVGRAYFHSGHWQGTNEYKVAVTKPATVLANTAGNAEALVRYVECRCLLGGVTTSQGITLQANSGIRSFYRGLVRNVESPTVPELPAAKPRIGAPDKDLDRYLQKLKDAPKCYLQHLSEGINDGVFNTALKQFTNLEKDDGSWALWESMCGVHSTALLPEHLQVLSNHGGSMVWSPLSNLLLYGRTTDVKAAKEARVPIALGSDWAPSGSKNLLGELKVAWVISEELGGLFKPRELCEMVTATPAGILGWQDHVGTLGAGKLADLIVVDDTTGDPYEKLIRARETSLTLVVIGGIPRVGQQRLMGKFDHVQREVIEVGHSKRILDLTPQPGEVDLGLTLDDAKRRLADTLENLPDRAQELDDAIAAGWSPGVRFATVGADAALLPPGWEEPPLRVVLEFEEEPGEEGFLEALRGADLADWVQPMKLAGITVPDDPGFLRALMNARNLPLFVKEELPRLHGVALAVPKGAVETGEAGEGLSDDLLSATELREFLTDERTLSEAERRLICQQAIRLLEGYYVHLPMKRTMHAVDPLQRLRILGHELEQGRGMDLSDLDFHREIIAVFDSVRDLHTTYRLPRPFRGKVAWLPFLIEEGVDQDAKAKRFFVSKLVGDPGPGTFKKGAEILHWNGVPIGRFVADLAQQMPGGNPAARWARAMNSLTLRSLTRGQIPSEDWVRISYRTEGGRTTHYQQPWLLFSPRLGGRNLSPEHFGRAEAAGLGLDDQTDDLQHAKKALFARGQIEKEARMAAGSVPPSATPDEIPTALPTVFRARRVYSDNSTEFGYLRVFTFNVNDADEFIEEFERLLGEFSPQGLIIDVRGNGGGLITAAERALELLSPRRIEPEPAQFINTPGTLRLCQQHRASTQLPGLKLEPWLHSIERSVASGATHSLAFPITEPEICNVKGQRYQGPKILIVDGLCYSATDMFIAGFQDHGIGRILGIHSTTGAGGANVWSHRLLRFLSVGGAEVEDLRPLPKGADLRVAVRRTLRVGPNAGELVEDFGINPDILYEMTDHDVLGDNEKLIEAAIREIKSMPYYRLNVESIDEVLTVDAPGADTVQLTAKSWPVGAFQLDEAGHAEIHRPSLPLLGRTSRELEVVAYAENRPVARTRYALPTEQGRSS